MGPDFWLYVTYVVAIYLAIVTILYFRTGKVVYIRAVSVGIILIWLAGMVSIVEIIAAINTN